MKLILLIVTTILISCTSDNHRNSIGKSEAISIAEKKLIQVYGKLNIERQKPLRVTETATSWLILGTLNCSGTEPCKGGVATIELKKDDGEVVRISHSK